MNVVTGQPGMLPGGMGLGLEILNGVGEVVVDQQIELCEALTGFEQKNRYLIMDNRGNQLFYMKEETDCCTRQCCGPNRPFNFNITNNVGQEVLNLERGCECCVCCVDIFCCTLATHRLSVRNPAQMEVGSVEMESVCFTPTVHVRDSAGNNIYTIVGGACQCSCGNDINYRIIESKSGDEVGSITKEYNGCCLEVFTNADKYRIQFPVGADAMSKGLLISAVLTIDFLFYEFNNNNNNN